MNEMKYNEENVCLLLKMYNLTFEIVEIQKDVDFVVDVYIQIK